MYPHYFYIVENNYHQHDRTSLPSPIAGLVYVLTHHTKPGMLQQNLPFVSIALTSGIPFETVGDAQALSTFLQFQHPILLIHLMLVCHVLLVLQKKFSTNKLLLLLLSLLMLQNEGFLSQILYPGHPIMFRGNF